LDKALCTDLLGQASQEVGVILSDVQIELLWLYLQEILEWNRIFNLTSIQDPQDIIIKHFVDSLTPLPYLASSGHLLDMGPGAGFPSIPMKIAAPELRVHLVEASRKKVSFLKHIIRTLNLQSIAAVHSRLEDMELPDHRFQTIISRAFLNIKPLLKLASPLLQPGNTLVAMLGPTTKEDHGRYTALASESHLELNRIVPLELPRSRGGRTLLFFHKVENRS
jgi:16S rRNA (guanine527-N7)-methyltransferase